jgi:8-oxo-dGTP pyrophosphatase MutT (NUDIX family)
VRQPHEAIVAVLRGREVLLMHRSPRSGGYWHLVSGGLEGDETAEAAAQRELREETGLEAPVRPFGWQYRYPLDEEPGRIAQFPPGTGAIAVDVFVVDAPAGWEPELNDEHDGYRWCGADEAEALLRWPEPRELAARLLR